MIKHTPLVRRIVNILGLISVVGGTVGILIILGVVKWRAYQATLSCEEWLEEVTRPNAFAGKVTAIREEGDCSWFLQLDVVDTEQIGLCPCREGEGLADFVAVGDSLYKQAGTLELEVVKPAGERRRFPFPCCE
jgi:hypothetical protein